MKPSLGVNLAGLKLKNPVIAASGTFASGVEYSRLIDIDILGAIIVKSITLKETEGNRPPRICETPSGMLNSIGLQNRGLEYFLENELPQLQRGKPAVIVSIAGTTEADYVKIARKLAKEPGVDAIEMNVSCPNVKKGGMAFGVSPNLLSSLVASVKAVYKKPLIVKLTPNVTDIGKMAKVAVRSGADILSLINTVGGMVIDTSTWRPAVASVTGGLSGPAIRPIALRMVWEVARKVDVPIIGVGGIETADDAVQFMLAGASAVAIGTANFYNPNTASSIVNGLDDYLERHSQKDIYSIINKVRINE